MRHSHLELLFGEGTSSAAADAAFPVPASYMSSLRSDLASRADAAGVLDVSYCTIPSPVGDLLLAATPRGLLRVGFASEGFDSILDAIAHKVSPRILDANARLEAPIRQLNEYFAGDRRSFDLPLDYGMSTGFRLQVQQFLPHIDYGGTLAYKEVAARVGRPNAVRAVGTACAKNPLPIVLPCHRVLPSSGALGGYVGGPAAKRALLDLEAA